MLHTAHSMLNEIILFLAEIADYTHCDFFLGIFGSTHNMNEASVNKRS